MKILAINGSYRTNGNTARVVNLIENKLRLEADRAGELLNFEKVDLGKLNIQMCRGCRICFDRDEEQCPLKDDLLLVKAKINQADGVIVSSPVYVNDVNGITKNWIDRMAHVCHRPEFAGKCVYLLATVADGPTSHALTTLNMALRTWGFHLIGQKGFKTGALMKAEDIGSRFQNQIGIIAKMIFRAIHERQFTYPSFLSLMTFRIQQRAWQKHADDSLDYQYWKEQGWLDARRSFYITHNANIIKVGGARLVGSWMAPFVT